MKTSPNFFIFLFIISFISAFAHLDTPTGTLIVSYNTNEKGERIDRIRFWVRNEKLEQQMYPKGSAFVEDRETLSRTVVIEDLPVGKYELEFLIPNTDGLFESVPIKAITVTSNNVVKIDQKITPQFNQVKSETETNYALFEQFDPTLEDINLYEIHGAIDAACPVSISDCQTEIDKLVTENEGIVNPTDEIAMTPSAPIPTQEEKHADETAIVIINYPQYPYYYEVYAYLNVVSNLPEATWILYDGDVRIASGGGLSTRLQIRPSSTLSIRADKLDDYDVEVVPSGRFSLAPNGFMTAQITYKPTFGNIEIRLPSELHHKIKGEVVPEEGGTALVTFSLDPNKGEFSWKSSDLTPGYYTIRFYDIQNYESIKSQRVKVKGRQVTRVFPEIVAMGVITVNTNIPDATYELRNERNDQKWQGEGSEFTFKGLPEGTYIIKFHNDKNRMYMAPDQKRVFLGSSRQAQVRARYEMAGELQIISDINRFKVIVKEIYGKRKQFEEIISKGTGTFYLPEGKYSLSFVPLESGKGTPKPIEVKVKSLQKEQVSVQFPLSTESNLQTQAQKSVTIHSNIKNAAFSMTSEGDDSTTQNYFGKKVKIQLEKGKNYTIQFLDIPGYEAPKPLVIDSDSTNDQEITAPYTLKYELIPIDGDNPFSIGKYEVTNEEFSQWLNQAYLNKEVFFHNEGILKNTITDAENHVLCKVQDEGIYSQIAVFGQKSTLIKFQAVPGRERHPVTYVSWYGAKKYCEDNGFRLPTEKEWEIAAGINFEDPTKSFLFGFSRNEIDRSWANYLFDPETSRSRKNLSTPVGFYNGTNKLPLILGDYTQRSTSHAISPIGAYDMSGNVSEWVVGIDNTPVSKGGSYASSSEDLHINQRVVLKPDHTDQYTGFRVGADPF